MNPPFDARLLARFSVSPEEDAARLKTELERFGALLPALKPVWTEVGREGAWCPAQVVEHVIKVNDAASKVLHLLAREAPLPEVPREYGTLSGGKPQAPEALRPGESQAFDALVAAWETSTSRFRSEINKTYDWQGRRFFHPFFGELSAQEWVRAMSFHNAHHRKGLERDFCASKR